MDELSDIVPCGILLFDDGGRILKANATLCALLGYEPRSLEGKSVDTILSLASRVFYNTHFFPLIKLHSRADEIFLTLASRENKSIPVLSNAVRRSTPAGVENIVVFMPVVEREKFEAKILEAKRAAEDALQQNKELRRITQSLESHAQELERQNQKMHSINTDLVQFNKIISHDLQEPIRKIRLFSGMILRSTDDQLSDRSKVGIEKIQKSGERLSELTHGLQHYVKVDEEIKRHITSLGDCLSTAAARVKQVRNYEDVQFSFGQLPSIEGYPAQLELLFYHLIDNAIQFRKPDQPLNITVDHALVEENIYRSTPARYKFIEHVKIVFSDNGTGFDDQFSDDAFHLGRKFHSGSDGVGMGLALAKKIVGNHGGTIAIQSQAGKGTDVIILLPMRHPKPETH